MIHTTGALNIWTQSFKKDTVIMLKQSMAITCTSTVLYGSSLLLMFHGNNIDLPTYKKIAQDEGQ